MSYTLVAYGVLKDSIKESITTLIKSHYLDPLKLEESLAKLTDEKRGIQANFLLKTISLLDASPPQTEEARRVQARTLNAAAYFVREQINLSYGYTSPERSTLFNSLTTALDLTKENMPQAADLADMYAALEKFLRSHVYKSSDPRKGYLPDQPFNIKKYSVEADIKTLSTKVHGWRIEAIDKAEVLHLKEPEALKPPKSGILGIFGGSTSTKKEEPPTKSTLQSTI